MRACLLALLVACSSSSTSTSTSSSTTPSGTPPPATGSATQENAGSGTAGPGLGENCGPGDACGKGTCKMYYGIAGPRGPQFKTCEIDCGKDKTCPEGLTCRTIADGPGSVCR